MKTLLFFSRGRGHGHAIPDIDIAKELAERDPEWKIQFVSYATGAETFRAANIPVIDLEMPETNPYVETLVRCNQLIRTIQPTVVIAHEEFAAIAAAKLEKTPSIFISAWLPPANAPVLAESIAAASSIIMLAQPGIFELPPRTHCNPVYVGDIVRKMKYSREDRERLRVELNIPSNALLLLVVPGGHTTERTTPMANIVIEAFQKLQHSPKLLFWIGKNDFEFMSACAANVPGLRAVRFISPIEKLMAAADVVVTKGTRGTTLDAASLGIPSISLSFGSNPVDDMLVPRFRSNIALNAKATSADILLQYIDSCLRDAAPKAIVSAGSAPVVDAMLREFRRLGVSS